jgi:hypothetical protein
VLSADIFSLGCIFVEMSATLASYYASRFPPERGDETSGLIESTVTVQAPSPEILRLREHLSRNEYGDTSYQANIAAIRSFLDSLQIPDNPASFAIILPCTWLVLKTTISQMIDQEPTVRPQASWLAQYTFGENPCCQLAADPLEALRLVPVSTTQDTR